MNLSLRALRYLVATADAGNLTEAARALNVSQPSISAAIAQIERAYGIQIFVRHHARGVTLTCAGQRLVNDARLLLYHARDFDKSALSLGGELKGEIVIGCFTMLATRFMPGLLSAFSKLHPGMSLRLEEGDQEEVLEALLSGRTEIAISYNFGLPDDILGERLTDLPPFVVVSAKHPSAGLRKVSLRTFSKEPFILLDLPHSREYFLGLFSACGIEPRIGFRSRSYEFIRGLVGKGHGFTIHNAVPRTTMTYDGSSIAVLPITEPLMPVGVMRLRLKRHVLRPAVEAFWTFLGSAFRKGGLFEPGSVAPVRLRR
jgi:DNA-binding transcriptional LysR family regulator